MAVNLIDSGRMQLAEHLVTAVQKYHLGQWQRYRSAGLANMFMRAYHLVGDQDGFQRWREWLWSSTTAVVPDAMSYSIVFDVLLSQSNPQECKQLAERMALDGIEMRLLTAIRYLSQVRLEALCAILDVSLANTDPDHEMVSLETLKEDFGVLSVPSPSLGAVPLTPLPNVNSIKSKSDGISFLKTAIKTLRDNPNVDLFSLQESLEQDCYEATSQRLYQELEQFRAATNSPNHSRIMQKLIKGWQEDLTVHLRKALKESASLNETSLRTVKIGSGLLFSSILSALEVEKISLVCLQELTRSSSYDQSAGGFPLNRLSSSIGQALEREVFAQQLRSKQFLQHTHLSPVQLARIFSNRYLFETTMRKQYAALERNAEALRDGWIPRWSSQLRAEIGTFITAVAISSLKFVTKTNESLPAFYHKIGCRNGQSLGLVGVHAELLEIMNSDATFLFVEPWAMPMLVHPKPWITYNSGGYLTQRMTCVRLKDDPLHLSVIHQADKEGKLDKILLGLDVLGRTPWRINDAILRVAVEMWNTGINVATLEKPEALSAFEFKAKDAFATHEEYVAYVRRSVERKEAIGKAHSTMCDTNYKLEIARQFAGLQFYLPHSVDFRGRAYPIPPHLSHVGSDLSRGLLMFGEGRPLGGRGLRWLKIQLANMSGFDKASLDERAIFADTHREDIMDSADNPVGGRQWWRKADEPWQCLATCMELTAAWRSPSPAEFVSHLPCQTDGSCNGLQHYAALGRDVDGAKQVNLAPSDRPQDVYAAVSQLVAARVEKDAAADATHIAAQLVGKINRKIVKQTVMTNVYGVTKYGARMQIQERLKEFNLVVPEKYGEARLYLANLVLSSLGTLFDKAQRIQEWLSVTAEEIGRSVPPQVAARFGSALGRPDGDVIVTEVEETDKPAGLDPADRYPQTSVMWTTPLGFQVVQPYNKTRKIMLRTVLQSLSLRMSSQFDPVDVPKQASAFPPNFVHSLDATHMFMTALACAKEEVTFASVHDCFWTHASMVDRMGHILREQFVAMHSQPILERLREEFVARYRGHVVPERLHRSHPGRGAPTGDIKHMQVDAWRPIRIPPLPPRGDFDIASVLTSDYFFS